MNFLPGWAPGLIIAGSAQAAAEIEFVASSISTNATITLPTGIEAGDLIVIWHVALNDDYDDPPPSLVTPSGFTLVGSDTATFYKGESWRCALHWKEADGTEDGAVLNVMNGSHGGYNPDERSIALVFRMTPAATGITAHDPRVDASTSGVAQTTINASAGVVPLVCIDCYHALEADVASVFPQANAIKNPASGNGDNSVAVIYNIFNNNPEDLLTGSNWQSQASLYFEMV